MVDIKEVLEKQNTFRGLFNRMDDDRDLYYLSKYVMRDKDNRDVPGVINLTLNIPAVFAGHVMSALGAASQQVVVEGEGISDEQKGQVRGFVNAAVESTDLRLMRQAKPRLQPFFTEQVCIRGSAAARVCWRMENGVLIADTEPVDTRHFVYQTGRGGLKWAAQRMTLSRAEMEDQFPAASSSLRDRKDYEIWDVWDDEANVVYHGNTKLTEQENTYGYPPFIFQAVPLGSMLQDRESFEHRGESIFFLIRDLIPEFNRIASIYQTLNMASFKGAKTWHSKSGPSAEPPDDVDELGNITSADIGGGVEMVPSADIKEAGRLLHGLLDELIQAGSQSRLDYGNIPFPLSGVAMIELGEKGDQIFLPRLGAVGLIFQQLADMVIDQVRGLDGPIELGRKGHKRRWEVSALEGEYGIEYRYTVRSTKTENARFSMAAAAEKYLDEDTILRDLIRAEDPEKIRRKRRVDLAEKTIPKVALYREARAAIDEGETVLASIIGEELGFSIEEIGTGRVAGPRQGPPETPEDIPLLPQGPAGGGVGRK
ncbi:MAG: hypothetical protein V3S82_07255 [Dehalococcoidia bacterium]